MREGVRLGQDAARRSRPTRPVANSGCTRDISISWFAYSICTSAARGAVYGNSASRRRKQLHGDIIYNYQLKKARKEGYFKSIRFEPVVAFNRQKADQAIAAKAIDRLSADADKGHILMARADDFARTREVFRLYEPYEGFHPVDLHAGIKSVLNARRFAARLLRATQYCGAPIEIRWNPNRMEQRNGRVDRHGNGPMTYTFMISFGPTAGR